MFCSEKQQNVDKRERKGYNNFATQLHRKPHLWENILAKGVFPLSLYHKWEGNCVATSGESHFFGAPLGAHFFSCTSRF